MYFSMKRRTSDFISRQNGEKVNFFARFTPKQYIIAGVVVVVLLVLGYLAVWYSGNYINKHDINVTNPAGVSLDYEWKDSASRHGVVGDYLISRTTSLLVDQRADDTLIVSSYMLPGRLATEEGKESGIYLLSDQALLLKTYLAQNNRFAAVNLVNEINSRFPCNGQGLHPDYISSNETTSITFGVSSNLDFLEAYIDYYALYGKKSDFDNISSLVESVFDENGLLIPHDITVGSYQDLPQVGIAGEAVLEESSLKTTFNGTLVSDVNLYLIKVLEDNDLLPEGSYDRNLDLVKGAKVSDEIPLYAYAYYINDGGETVYMYASGETSTLDVVSSVKTLMNLALAGENDAASVSFIKTEMINSSVLLDTYYYNSGHIEGLENRDVYAYLMAIAKATGDYDLYEATVSVIGNYVATRSASPALSMLFEVENGRNICYARDNLYAFLYLF